MITKIIVFAPIIIIFWSIAIISIATVINIALDLIERVFNL